MNKQYFVPGFFAILSPEFYYNPNRCMKNISTILAATLLFITLFAACSKGDGPGPNPVNPPADKGPWDGTYKMESVYTSFADTNDYIMYGGIDRKIYTGFRADTGYSGAIVITKDKIAHQGIMIMRRDSSNLASYNSTTNQTTNSKTGSYGTVSANPSNIQSAYATSGTDSVAITDVTVVPLPFGSYDANTKLKFVYAGSSLTLYNTFYKREKVGSGPGAYEWKRSYNTVAVYRKQ